VEWNPGPKRRGDMPRKKNVKLRPSILAQRKKRKKKEKIIRRGGPIRRGKYAQEGGLLLTVGKEKA